LLHSGQSATVLALIFSVALLVLSMVSTLFGPRLLYRFPQDWDTGLRSENIGGIILRQHKRPSDAFVDRVLIFVTDVVSSMTGA
jgi:hypothetical protein